MRTHTSRTRNTATLRAHRPLGQKEDAVLLVNVRAPHPAMKVHGSMYQAGMHCSSQKKEQKIWLRLLRVMQSMASEHEIGCTPASSAFFKRHSAKSTPVRVRAKMHRLVGCVCRVQCDRCDILEDTTFDIDKVEVAFHA